LGYTSAVPDATAFTNSIGMSMVRIERGKFMMGSDGSDWDERPVDEVTITQLLYMAALDDWKIDVNGANTTNNI